MTSVVTITDTGKRRTSSASAEETDIANSGSTLTLYGTQVTLEEEALLNTESSVGKLSSGSGTSWSYGEVDTIGIMKPKWTVKGLLDDRSASDMAIIKPLRLMSRTKGYKTLSGDLPDWSDGTSNSSVVNVHVKSVKIIHDSNNNLISYTITMFETE